MKFVSVIINVIFFASLIGCTYDTITNSFKDYSEMESSGIFAKGWLPDYLPKSATNIKEKHDLDSNIVNATFNFNPKDVQSVMENCELIKETEAEYNFICKISGQAATLHMYKNGKAEYSSSSM